MTRADEQALEKRKVVALERIADALEDMNGAPMTANRPQMLDGRAARLPPADSEALNPPAAASPRVVEETDEVEPMNDEG